MICDRSLVLAGAVVALATGCSWSGASGPVDCPGGRRTSPGQARLQERAAALRFGEGGRAAAGSGGHVRPPGQGRLQDLRPGGRDPLASAGVGVGLSGCQSATGALHRVPGRRIGYVAGQSRGLAGVGVYRWGTGASSTVAPFLSLMTRTLNLSTSPMSLVLTLA